MWFWGKVTTCTPGRCSIQFGSELNHFSGSSEGKACQSVEFRVTLPFGRMVWCWLTSPRRPVPWLVLRIACLHPQMHTIKEEDRCCSFFDKLQKTITSMFLEASASNLHMYVSQSPTKPLASFSWISENITFCDFETRLLP